MLKLYLFITAVIFLGVASILKVRDTKTNEPIDGATRVFQVFFAILSFMGFAILITSVIQ